MVGDVVAVQAFRACLEIRRRISISHAQRMQIWHDLTRLSKGEPAIELQSVGRTGNSRCFILSSQSKISIAARSCAGTQRGFLDYARMCQGFTFFPVL